MNSYSIFIIIKYDNILNIKNFISIFKNIVIYNNCLILAAEEWGYRNFSYNLNNYSKGYYIHFVLNLDSYIFDNLNYYLKFSPMVLRFLFIRLRKRNYNIGSFVMKKVYLKNIKELKIAKEKKKKDRVSKKNTKKKKNPNYKK